MVSNIPSKNIKFMFGKFCFFSSLALFVELTTYRKMEIETKDVTDKKYEIKFVKSMVLLALFITTGILTGIYCMIFGNVCGSTYLWSKCFCEINSSSLPKTDKKVISTG